jgi:hypothetical protein
VSVISVNLSRQHFTRHGLHTNSKGKEQMCQQIAELVQREFSVVRNVIPLKYKEDTVHEEAALVDFSRPIFKLHGAINKGRSTAGRTYVN